VYTSGNEVRLRTYRNAGDEPPIANAGGPYNGLEGTSIVFNGSGSSDIGRNAGIVSYAWDFRNDGTWDAISATPTVSTVYPDAFTGQVRLGVTDRAGRTAEATAAVTVTDVPPTLSIQSARNVREGEVVSFQATVTDPGQDPHTVTWAFGNGASAQGESVSHAFPNDGVYEVTATVTDNKGQSAEASVIVVAANVSPTVNAGGPYSGPAGATIHFEGSATDPGILDLLTFSWDLDGNGSFESTGRNPIRLFPAWGRFLVRLRVTDDGGAMGSDTAVVVIANDTPVVTHVADQVANEGSAFTPLPLDPLVTDPLHRDDEIAWTARGQSSLLASVANRILSVHPLDGDWSGSEWLMLVAEDPRGNRDSTRIRFTVLPVNDPPVWDRHVPPLVLPEDSSASVSVDSLRKWVHDDDHPIDSLSFGVRVGVHFTWSSDPDRRVFVFQPVRDWFGEESVVFVVSDPFGAASFDTCRVRVMEVLEPPGPFALEDPLYFHADAWPDTIRFRWNASHTADPIGVVYYAWTLRQQDGVIDPLRRVVAFDTSLAFIPDPFLGDGVFFWNVEAVDQYEQFQRSDNMGILQIGQASAVPAALEIPTSFGLLQNYPNPFNPETSISFQLPEPAAVRLALYNPVGQEVRVLAEGRKPAGVHTVVWDGRDRREERVPSGVYIYRLEAGNRVLYRKMLLLQ
jgi:PKD repeat protein